MASTGMSAQRSECSGFGRAEELYYGSSGHTSEGGQSWRQFPPSSTGEESRAPRSPPYVQSALPVLFPATYSFYGSPVAMATYGILSHPLQQSYVARHDLQIEWAGHRVGGADDGESPGVYGGPTVTQPEDTTRSTSSSTQGQSSDKAAYSREQLVIEDVSDEELETSCRDSESTLLELDTCDAEANH